jgi:hypothetical protein
MKQEHHKQEASDKHVVRFYFWQNRYDRAVHTPNSAEGELLSWEDREFGSFSEAMSFARMIDSHWLKITNCHGHVIFNSHDHGSHLTYA